MEFGLSSTSDKGILKLDPRTKLCLLIAISLIMVGGKTVGSEFMTAMDKMHVPYFITIPFSVMFRYFPTLGEEYRSIHDAMKMREIGQSVKNPFTYIEYVLVPIMMSTVRIADELSAASLTKGLCAGGRRTHICQISIRFYDWLLVLGALAMIVLFFVF